MVTQQFGGEKYSNCHHICITSHHNNITIECLLLCSPLRTRCRTMVGLIFMPRLWTGSVPCARPWRRGSPLTPTMWWSFTARLAHKGGLAQCTDTYLIDRQWKTEYC